MDSIDKRFIENSIQLISVNYLPKLKEALALVNEHEIWEKDGEKTNSIANLLLHLTGNLRQHIISGIGGAEDVRTRPEEFGMTSGILKDKLIADLEATVGEACAVLEKMDPSLLKISRVIQDQTVTIFDDLFHTVEHFAYHTGQIIHIIKFRKEHHFQWYAHLEPRF